MKEAIIHELEFEAPKNASRNQRYLHHIRDVKEQKDDNSVIETIKLMFQKYFDQKPTKECRPKEKKLHTMRKCKSPPKMYLQGTVNRLWKPNCMRGRKMADHVPNSALQILQ